MGENKKAPPPPPGSDERRIAERLEILAQIDLRRGDDDDVQVLEATNISIGGMFVRVDEGYEEFSVEVGDTVSVYLNLGQGTDGKELELTSDAEVVRKAIVGFGLMWTSSDPAVMQALSAIMNHVRDRKGGGNSPR